MSDRDISRTLQGIASPIEARSTWDDLAFLPNDQVSALWSLTAQARQRLAGERDAQSGDSGSLAALFIGSSGTGKTMAAEVLARELQLNLYRVDSRAVVSKYIGETEKNLSHLFDAARSSSSILFFDEADALFGKRSQVRDSHDRYANLEINALMDGIEAARGVLILAVEREDLLDAACLRRVQFRVHFPSSPENRAT